MLCEMERIHAFCVCLLLGTTVVVSSSESCPSEESIYPCRCEEEVYGITVSCYEPEDEPTLSLDQLKKILNNLRSARNIDLELEALNLGSVPSSFFQGLRIRKLEISHCEIQSLTDGTGPVFKGLEDSLEELEILSSINDINLSLGHLRKLKEVDLSYNKIPELGNSWFSNGPESLTELIISNNDIGKLGDKAFSSLNNLRVLSIDGNRFGPIKRSMLPSAPMQLLKLELDNNDLKEIPDDLLLLMPSLQTVSLRTNQISRLEKRTWLTVWSQLKTIHLEGNPLNCDEHMHWMFHVSMAKPIFGTCVAPKDKAGQRLRDIIELNFRP